MAKPARKKSIREARAALYRSLVLEAAEQVFAEKGFEDAKMQEIAGEAGLSLGTVYGVFPGKWELYRAVHEARLGEMTARAEAASAPEAPPLDRPLEGIAAYVRFLLSLIHI